MSFVESVALLLLTTVLGGLLIPFITRRWQQQQKALDIKAELISDMTELAAEMIEEKTYGIRVQMAELISLAGGEQVLEDPPGPGKGFFSRTNDWSKRRAIIESRLKVYFPDTQVVKAWGDLTTALLNYVWLDHFPERIGRANLIAEIKKYIGESLENNEWERLAEVKANLNSEQKSAHDSYNFAVGNALAFKLDAVIELVMKSRIYGEFRLRKRFYQ